MKTLYCLRALLYALRCQGFAECPSHGKAFMGLYCSICVGGLS